jgi:hypothetical protein
MIFYFVGSLATARKSFKKVQEFVKKVFGDMVETRTVDQRHLRAKASIC